MSTNAGSKVVSKEATRKGYGKVLYDPDAMTNLRSLSEMVRRGYRVQMDTDLENLFLVTSPDGEEIKFSCDKKGLYVLAHVNQIEGFTDREVQRAERAKRLYYNLDAPSLSELKHWVRTNQGKNVPVSYEDIKLLERMEKCDVPTVKGKTVKPHPPVVSKEDYVEMPKELDVKGMVIEMAIDVMYINDVSFLHSIDRKIKFRALVPLGRRKKKKDHTWLELFNG